MDNQIYNKQENNSNAPMVRPDSNLVWAILCTCLCCVPLGIVSIVYSTKVDSLWAQGDYAGAIDASKKAKKWAIWGAVATAIGIAAYLFIYAIILIIAIANS